MTEDSDEVRELQGFGVEPGTVQITSLMFECQAEGHGEAVQKARDKCAQLEANCDLAIEGRFELNESSVRTADYYEEVNGEEDL